VNEEFRVFLLDCQPPPLKPLPAAQLPISAIANLLEWILFRGRHSRAYDRHSSPKNRLLPVAAAAPSLRRPAIAPGLIPQPFAESLPWWPGCNPPLDLGGRVLSSRYPHLGKIASSVAPLTSSRQHRADGVGGRYLPTIRASLKQIGVSENRFLSFSVSAMRRQARNRPS